jgi:hypothetical protein
MAFTLRIRFSGLCLFTVEPASGGNPEHVHVLLPKAVGSLHRHVPVLQFDPVHMLQGGSSTNVAAQLLLRGFVLNVDGPNLDSRICNGIVDLGQVTHGPVRTELFADDPNNLLAARVTLNGGKMTRLRRGKCWMWVNGERRRLAHVAEWEIAMPGNSVQWVLGKLAGSPEPPVVPQLYPTADGILNVLVRHLTPGDLAFEAEEPTPPVSAEHFTLYYPLFEGNPGTAVPTDPIDPPAPPAPPCGPVQDCTGEIIDTGETGFNCMLGQA